jgi:PAS domain S-box-containing protein
MSDPHESEPATRIADIPNLSEFVAGLFGAAPFGLQVFRADGTSVLTNRAFAELFGAVPPPEYNVLEDEIAEQNGVSDFIRRAFEGEVVTVPTVWYDPRELTQVHIEERNRVAISATFFPIRNEQGAVCYVGVAFKDEAAETTYREGLERERSALVLAQRIAHLGFWELDLGNLHDLDRNPLRWSDEVFRIFGHEPRSIEVTNDNFFEAVHPEDRALIREAVRRALEEGIEYCVEHRILRPDGELRWVQEQSQVERDAVGKPVRMVGTVLDITDRKRFAEQIEEARRQLALQNALLQQTMHSTERRIEERTAELAAANRELESFAYSISHDLRTPLRSLDGFSKILLEEYEDKLDEEGKDSLHRIRRAAIRMSKLIDGLLALSRLGRTDLCPTTFSSEELVREVWEDLAPQRVGREIELRLKPLPECTADRTLLAQVFTNLIGNAIKFTATKDRAVIEIGSEVRKGRRIWYVQDDGAGFDMRFADKLFGVFQRLHQASEFEGNGVGLALAQRIVHRHGGEIWGESEPNRGARLSFTLSGLGVAGLGADRTSTRA